MGKLFSYKGYSYTEETIEKLCIAICKEKNIVYKRYLIKFDTVCIYDVNDVLSYLILFEDLKDYRLKYNIDNTNPVNKIKDKYKNDRIMDRTGTIFYTKDIVDLGLAIAKYHNLKFVEYEREGNNSLKYFLTDGVTNYTYSFRIRYFSECIDYFVNNNLEIECYTTLVKL